MEEADRLADDIVVIDRGRMIAHGTSEELKTQIGGERVEMVLARSADLPSARAILTQLSVDEVQVEEHTRRLTAGVTGGVEGLRNVLHQLAEAHVAVVDVGLRRPTLDDVFLSLTGHSAEQVTESDGEAGGDAGGDAEAQRGDTREKEAVR